MNFCIRSPFQARFHPRLLLVLCLAWASTESADSRTAASAETGLSLANAESIGLRSAQLQYIDSAVRAAIEAGEIPGAVVLVARHGKIGFLKAFGNRALEPMTERMTTDTIFDVASLTKVLATTPSILFLLERGLVRANEKVTRYLPGFATGGKRSITVKLLLTHHSGLRADFDLSVPWTGYDAALRQLWKEEVHGQPGHAFAYSDLNFIALGEIVQSLSGKTLQDFVAENLYQPLGMHETSFRPPQRWLRRIAPTESRARSLAYLRGSRDKKSSPDVLRGEVHDPTAWRMGGVAGHAGLFSTARDIAIYAQMHLNLGSYAGKRVFAPGTIRASTRRQSPAESGVSRGFGWDIESPFSAPRGDLLEGGYGHTGFTGTSLWIHPATDSFFVVLTNRVHPSGKGHVTHLRAVIANIVAASIADGV